MPSNKPRFEGLLPEDLAEKAEDFLKDKDISRSKLVQYAIALYIDESRMHISLDDEQQQKIRAIAAKNFRTPELEAQYAIQKYIQEITADS